MLCTRTRAGTSTLGIKCVHVHRHIQYTYMDMFTYIVLVQILGHGHVVHVHVHVYVHVHIHVHVHAHVQIHIHVHVQDPVRGPQKGEGPQCEEHPKKVADRPSCQTSRGPRKGGRPTQSPKWSLVNRDFNMNPCGKFPPFHRGSRRFSPILTVFGTIFRKK